MSSLLSASEAKLLRSVTAIAYANPFLPELAEEERHALGREYVEQHPFWSFEVDDPDKRRANTWKLLPKIDRILDSVPLRIRRGAQPIDRELLLYEDASLYSVYHQFHDRLFELAVSQKDGRTPYYRDFLTLWRERLQRAEFTLPSAHDPRHMWACYFQIARAFHHIFTSIIGASLPAARVRAAVWQSVFTHDMRRYRRSFHQRMGEFTTLVTGPSGTGKELVARAVALSRYIPFDDRSCTFGVDLGAHFHPIHIGALTGTLVESELFGHKRGSFTGAMTDREGLLAACPPLGAVFLDEIGELNTELQMKLLRVIETRQFTPVGETKPIRFKGKIIAATNRSLPAMIANGSFREDLYYRLCSDVIETPSLSDQIQASPAVLKDLVTFMARRNAGEEADAFADEAYSWIIANLGECYPWPGNYRELEQCIRNLMIRREYRPAKAQIPAALNEDPVFGAALQGTLTAEELLRRYCTYVYAQTGSYEETSRRVELDRRTVKSKVDKGLLDRMRRGAHRTSKA